MMRKTEAILAGDVGGTKTYLGLFIPKGKKLHPVRVDKFANRDYRGLEAVIEDFLLASPACRITGAAFGIAGPVEAAARGLTNIPWRLDEEGIRKGFRIKKMGLLNDLVATGWGLDGVSKKDIAFLQRGSPQKGNAALIAAGTGLGEAILFWDGVKRVPSSSEGGHADFAPRDKIESDLLGYLMKRHSHVSYERVLSGPGLEGIYSFLKERSGQREPRRLREKFRVSGDDRAVVISEEAMNGGDINCREALKLFVSIYGAEAGNLALKSMAVGGVYVGGGIAPKILKALRGGAFIDSFVKKGRFESFLRRIPVCVVLNEKTALFGAAHYANFLLADC